MEVLFIIGLTFALKAGWEALRDDYRRNQSAHAAQVKKAYPKWTKKQRKAAASRHAVAYTASNVLHGFPGFRQGVSQGWRAHRTARLEGRAQHLTGAREHRERQEEALRRIREEERQARERATEPVPAAPAGAAAPVPAGDLPPARDEAPADAGTGSGTQPEPEPEPWAEPESWSAAGRAHRPESDSPDDQGETERGADDLGEYSEPRNPEWLRQAGEEYHARPSRRFDGEPETVADREFFDLRESGYTGPVVFRDGHARVPDMTDPLDADGVRTAEAMRARAELAAGNGTHPNGGNNVTTATTGEVTGYSAVLEITAAYKQRAEQEKDAAAEARAQATALRHAATSLCDGLQAHDVDAASLAEAAELMDAADALDAAAGAREQAADSLYSAADRLSNGVRGRHGGVADAVAGQPVDMARREFYANQ
jgi:hypothetical protein